MTSANRYPRASAIRLAPLTGVLEEDGQFVALSAEPWLEICPLNPWQGGRWLEMTYSASYLDPLVRPLVRCIGPSLDHIEILPAPLFGRAIWRGPLPEGTQTLHISPVAQSGPFAFRIDNLRIIRAPELYARTALKGRRQAWAALSARLRGFGYLSEIVLRRSVGSTELKDYHGWRLRRYRAFDPGGLDRQRLQPNSCPRIVLLTDAADANRAWVEDFVLALQRQSYPNWQVAWVTHSTLAHGAQRAEARLVGWDGKAPLAAALGALPDDALVAYVPCGARLDASALPVVAEAAANHPAIDVFYADEDTITPRGRYCEPRFKPDWAPTQFASRDYLGAARFYRARLLPQKMTLAQIGNLPALMAQCVAGRSLSAGVALHIARVVMTLPEGSHDPHLQFPPTPPAPHAVVEPLEDERAAIVIPTKDRKDLLQRCIDSLQRHSAGGSMEIIIVDNGSTDREALGYLDKLSQQPGIKVLQRSGPFNFSQLSNDGAAATQAPFLVFLNNDTEIINADWLRNLLAFARRAEIGAVGAKLLYPDRRLQHGGIVLGIDGRAGHFQRKIEEHSDGYFGRLNVPHEIAAVTGACLAVERAKFASVGGFDAVNLPVDLNDVDLCLRLAERGWRTLLATNVVILHQESVSRGSARHPNARYAAERQYFRTRWMSVLRQSPGFHPALSLDGFAARLG